MIKIGDFFYVKIDPILSPVGYLLHNCGHTECIFRFEWDGSSWSIKKTAYTLTGHRITQEEEQKVLFALSLPPL